MADKSGMRWAAAVILCGCMGGAMPLDAVPDTQDPMDGAAGAYSGTGEGAPAAVIVPLAMEDPGPEPLGAGGMMPPDMPDAGGGEPEPEPDAGSMDPPPAGMCPTLPGVLLECVGGYCAVRGTTQPAGLGSCNGGCGPDGECLSGNCVHRC